VSGNQLSALPPELARLTSLTTLDVSGNQLSALLPELARLTSLTTLDVSGNQLTALPAELSRLFSLEFLGLKNNKLTHLPLELGLLRQDLQLIADENPLTSPPPEIVSQGGQASLVYLQERLQGSKPQWVSKLLVVGEGGVGKTSLLRALRGESFNREESTTHGIEIGYLTLPHPDRDDVAMKLNTWDFGGQEIYHATHQFFLTNRSLFLLVWNARHGFEQGKLYYWLDTIQALAPDSPVLLVATWIDERDADLPFVELQRRYPQVVKHVSVSNRTSKGIDELRHAIQGMAVGLPLMGEAWPATWIAAADTIRSRTERSIAPSELRRMLQSNRVSTTSQPVLTRWLHELGDILYFQDAEELNDVVILQPHWLTQYISRVLESDEVIRRDGIFTRQEMDRLWHELDPAMRLHFLRLMEQFDLSYRTLENRDVSLVVERLPLDPPDFDQPWRETTQTGICEEITIRFRLGTVPAGIPTWFIARSHRFTTHTHWRNGALLAYRTDAAHNGIDFGRTSLALVRCFPHERYLELTVRGPHPQSFMALLKDGIELTLARFPGLGIDRRIPCPGHDGRPCAHEFDYEHLLKRYDRKRNLIECPASMEDVLVTELLYGWSWSTQDAVMSRINKLQDTMASEQSHILAELQVLREITQREFVNAFRRDQSLTESYCPSVFMLRPLGSSGWRKGLIGQKLSLQLYCQEPGCWHQAREGGRYEVNDPAKWLRTMAPFLIKLVSVLKYAAPLVGPWLAVVDAESYKTHFENDVALMKELVAMLPGFVPSIDATIVEGVAVENIGVPASMEGAALRALRRLLDEKDPQQHWGGLRNVLTPEGHYLWLCDYHAQPYLQ